MAVALLHDHQHRFAFLCHFALEVFLALVEEVCEGGRRRTVFDVDVFVCDKGRPLDELLFWLEWRVAAVEGVRACRGDAAILLCVGFGAAEFLGGEDGWLEGTLRALETALVLRHEVLQQNVRLRSHCVAH